MCGFDPEVMAQWDADEAEARGVRWNFPLNEDSLVYDFGGFTGEWSSVLIQKYNCRLHVFEPIKRFYDGLVDKFRDNLKVSVFPFGLWDSSGTGNILVDKASSSLFLPGDLHEIVELRDVAKLEIPDLVSINIEGSEYRVINRMLDVGWSTCPNIQVQFHNFYPDSARLRDDIRSRFSKTHAQIYNYPFVWEAWARI